ncbi:MAG: VCBS repeat-containing protein [Turneriella sp.]|nr:VCBS repeat-containing protein [Turneriella sp.]
MKIRNGLAMAVRPFGRIWQVLCISMTLAELSCKSWGKFWEVPSVTIAALGGRSTGELWSNTLIGNSTGSVSRVEVSVAGGSWAAASGTSPWRYAIPFSTKLKTGKKYIFSARAVDSDGAVIATQTGDLLRRENHDINGEGYADFVVAAPAKSASTGFVYIYYGAATPQYGASATNAPAIITGGGTQRSFGGALALGDVNGDGYADLVVGGEQYPTNGYSGAMWIFLGSSNGIPSQAANVSAPYVGLASGDYFGGAIAMGDLNGDGYQDVVVGARERPGPTGEIYAYLGSAAGLALTASTTKTGSGSERLGSSLAIIDLNNDGLADIIVGAPTASPTSLTYVFSGIASGFNTGAAATITGEGADRFGDYVTTGDFNNDGFVDIAVQARDHNAGLATQGKVYFFSGSATGYSNFTANSAIHLNFSGELVGSTLGRSMRIADANGDGFADLLFSAYQPASIPGKIYFLPGSKSGFSSANAATITQQITGITNGDGFGVSMSVKDINSDGLPDIIAGAYNRNAGAGSGQGTASVFLGSSAGFSSQSSAAAAFTLNGEAGGDNFGLLVY